LKIEGVGIKVFIAFYRKERDDDKKEKTQKSRN
jgi:hypothetical protein